MLTRRAVVIGASATVGLGGAALAGLAGLGSARQQRLLHDLGLAHSPDRSVRDSHTRVVSGTLASRHLAAPVGWSLSQPATGTRGVVYCLHGYNDDHRFAFDQIHLPDVVAVAGAPLAIAAVDGGPDSYWHARADGTDALSMLLDEFVPLIDARTGVTNRALLGWSMGGYGALLAAETAPQRFRAVAAASPALWTSAGQTARGAFDSPADYERNDVFRRVSALRSLTVRVDCGSSDSFYSADRKFAALLSPGPETSFGAGFHDAPYWRSVAPAQIGSLARVLA